MGLNGHGSLGFLDQFVETVLREAFDDVLIKCAYSLMLREPQIHNVQQGSLD